ncbi:filamentous hemagglutinin N-terminal domain-containing protein [Candidatus Albibeggiatoa sp. nov. BB20]|uniref:two-partner secretion domain-containing protein n=1 Tax=Candidatus Albibeggiatoa sp. nov. BB20 TaxID=3162723 RepID=UPI00336553D7
MQDVGQTVGNNLFHSFDRFNLNAGEIAQFSGSAQIQNVISRVVGNEPSLINGTIRSLMPNADFYFLNPNGIVFGEFAQLQVPNSFHASTADYLKLSDGGEFHARFPERDILTTAPIAAFGFLSESPATISTQSSKLVIASEKTLSLIGGDIHLNSDIPLTADNTQFIPTVETQSILATEHGRMNLASLASAGEVQLTENDVIVQGIGGHIQLNNTLIEMSGYSGGAVFIRAANFTMDNSIVRSNTFGDVDGKSISLKLTEAVYLSGLNNEISVATFSQKNSGGISIETPYLEMTGALMNTSSGLNGKASDIEINANNILMQYSAFISSGSINSGQSGNIRLNVKDTLSIKHFAPGYRFSHGINLKNHPSTVFSISSGIGDGGDIFINTQNLDLTHGFVSTDNFGMGQSGNITINTQHANLIDGGLISTSTFTTGQAGYINLNVAEKLYIAGEITLSQSAANVTWEKSPSIIRSFTTGEASGGILNIQANQIVMDDKGIISAEALNTGSAGDIFIDTNQLYISDNAQITTSANYALGGGIHLNINKMLYLNKSVITTSVYGGAGDGGNIDIVEPRFTVLNQGQIVAQANAGHGGNIRIVADQFLKSPSSLVSASSRLGIDGNIEITSPDETVSSGLLSLNKSFAEQAQIKDVCKAAIAGQLPTEFQPPLTLKVNMYRFQNDFVGDWIPSLAAPNLRLSAC